MCIENPSASLINMPDVQQPAMIIPIPNKNAPSIRGRLMAETPKKSKTPSERYLIAVIPSEATRIPVNLSLIHI